MSKVALELEFQDAEKRIEELESRLEQTRRELQKIKKAMIPHADICRKCPIRKATCAKQWKGHPSYGCNAIKNLGDAYCVLRELERALLEEAKK